MEKPVWNWKLQYENYKDQQVFDCMIAEFLLSDGRYFFNYESTLRNYKVTTLEELYVKQKKALEEKPTLYALFNDIELPLVPILWKMEQHGIQIDSAGLEKLGVLLNTEIGKVTEDIYSQIDEPINLGSPLQVGKLLVESFKVPLAKTATGKFATGEPELSKHAEQFPIIQKILKYRELSKLKSTYVEGLMKKISKESRIHTTFNQTGAITGRLSSSNPNLQNIPASDGIGKQIKSCFIPSPGHMLVSFDYSQQELRILAHLAQEPKLLQAFLESKDVHKVTASSIFKVDYDNVTHEQRYISKTINFGVLYGMGKFGMSQTLGITPAEAATFIDEFFKYYAEVQSFYAKYLTEAKEKNYAETILGRRRFVFDKANQKRELDNATRRELINFPIQGSAADLMKKAMVDVDREILQKRPEIRLMLQIHDELVFEIPDMNNEDLQSFVAEVSAIMNSTYKLDIPMKVEAKAGKKWGELEKVS